MTDQLLTVDQLIGILEKYNHRELHVHHTWRPNHSNFNGKNHQALQDGMRNFHVKSRGFADIAQHVTLFPDGLFLTGRSFNQNPASILNHNFGLPFCVEMLGNFDEGNDIFEGVQKSSMLKLAKFFDDRDKYVRFHNENAAKTCPGTSIVKSVFMSEVKAYGEVKLAEAPKVEVKSEVVTKPSTPKPTSTALRKGDRGASVKSMQSDLKAKGFSVGTIDGVFGSQTEEAVKAFQRITNLAVDGIAGPVTLAKLKEYALPDGVFRTGANNNRDKTKMIQQALNVAIGAGLTVDGVYGNGTASAVRKFQKRYGLIADGIYGPNTKRKLTEVLR